MSNEQVPDDRPVRPIPPADDAAPPAVLTIAGSDSGGSAGMQADLRTFLACGVHGMSAVTTVTVQNTVGVSDAVGIPPATVAAQIDAVAEDIGVSAAKTGVLASTSTIDTVAEACRRHGIGGTSQGPGAPAATPFVVDPVAAARSGEPLLADDALDALRYRLFPLATLVTPNLDEVRLLTGTEVRHRSELLDAAKAVHEFGPRWVLIKSGHLAGDPECVDLLYGTDARGDSVALSLPAPRYSTVHTHGAGDAFASAITASLARGAPMPEAVRYGKRFVTRAVEHAYPLGSGVGPVSTFWRVSPRSV